MSMKLSGSPSATGLKLFGVLVATTATTGCVTAPVDAPFGVSPETLEALEKANAEAAAAESREPRGNDGGGGDGGGGGGGPNG